MLALRNDNPTGSWVADGGSDAPGNKKFHIPSVFRQTSYGSRPHQSCIKATGISPSPFRMSFQQQAASYSYEPQNARRPENGSPDFMHDSPE